MRFMWDVMCALGALVVFVVLKVLAEYATKEAVGRLNQLPSVILKVARWRLPENLRDEMHDEWWEPDLRELLDREEARPITRLVRGLWFSVSLAVGARKAACAAGSPSRAQRLLEIYFRFFLDDLSGRDKVIAGVVVLFSGGLGCTVPQVAPNATGIGWATFFFGMDFGWLLMLSNTVFASWWSRRVSQRRSREG